MHGSTTTAMHNHPRHWSENDTENVLEQSLHPVIRAQSASRTLYVGCESAWGRQVVAHKSPQGMMYTFQSLVNTYSSPCQTRRALQKGEQSGLGKGVHEPTPEKLPAWLALYPLLRAWVTIVDDGTMGGVCFHTRNVSSVRTTRSK